MIETQGIDQNIKKRNVFKTNEIFHMTVFIIHAAQLGHDRLVKLICNLKRLSWIYKQNI